MPWEKIGLTNYPLIVATPMDLATVLRKLDGRQYATPEALRADVDLIWNNAEAFNGKESWIMKFVDTMRALAARKFSEAQLRGSAALVRKPSIVGGATGGAPARPVGGRPLVGVGNVKIYNETPHFITPQMRLQLLESAVKLKDEERVQLGTLARSLCPTAVEAVGEGRVGEGRETKIDVDSLTPAAFLRLDMHVRRQLASAAMHAKA